MQQVAPSFAVQRTTTMQRVFDEAVGPVRQVMALLALLSAIALVLASSPWCNVTVDGQARGTTPLNLKLKAGSHEVVLANPEFKIKRTLAVDIEPNQTVRKSLDFAPE